MPVNKVIRRLLRTLIKVTAFGVMDTDSNTTQKTIRITNLLAFLLCVVYLMGCYYNKAHNDARTPLLFVMGVFTAFIPLLNKHRYILISRILLCSIAVIELYFIESMIAFLKGGMYEYLNYLHLQMIIIGMSIFPAILFDYKKERKIYLTFVIINGALLVAHSLVFQLYVPVAPHSPISKDQIPILWLVSFASYGMINGGIHFLKRLNATFEDKLEKKALELTAINKELINSELKTRQIAEKRKSAMEKLKEMRTKLKKTLKEEQAFAKMLKETQSQLIHSEKMASVGQLTAGIAHEINNPVNFIKTGIDSLEENLEDLKQLDHLKDAAWTSICEAKKMGEIIDHNNYLDRFEQNIAAAKETIDYYIMVEELDHLIGSIKNGADRTAEIVAGLRTFSRLDESDFKPANIEENIDATLALIKNSFKEVTVVKNYAGIPNIDCIPGKLNQVFMNLISNAMQSIDGKGVLTLKTIHLASEGIVRITIQDTGKGIPKNAQRKIFTPFFTTKAVGNGTGLGLSISKGIIDDHHGQIYFETEENKGTTFFIDLPMVQQKHC